MFGPRPLMAQALHDGRQERPRGDVSAAPRYRVFCGIRTAKPRHLIKTGRPKPATRSTSWARRHADRPRAGGEDFLAWRSALTDHSLIAPFPSQDLWLPWRAVQLPVYDRSSTGNPFADPPMRHLGPDERPVGRYVISWRVCPPRYKWEYWLHVIFSTAVIAGSASLTDRLGHQWMIEAAIAGRCRRLGGDRASRPAGNMLQGPFRFREEHLVSHAGTLSQASGCADAYDCARHPWAHPPVVAAAGGASTLLRGGGAGSPPMSCRQ